MDVWSVEEWAQAWDPLRWAHYLEDEEGLELNGTWDWTQGEPLLMRDGTALYYRRQDAPGSGDPGPWEVARRAGVIITVVAMKDSYRVVSSDEDQPWTFNGAWEYGGSEVLTLARALHAAWEWDPTSAHAPAWFDRQKVTRRPLVA